MNIISDRKTNKLLLAEPVIKTNENARKSEHFTEFQSDVFVAFLFRVNSFVFLFDIIKKKFQMDERLLRLRHDTTDVRVFDWS